MQGRVGGGRQLGGGPPQQTGQGPNIMIGVCSGILVVTMVFLFASIDSLEPTEYGLKYNKFTKLVDRSYVYHGGRHFVGPLCSFLKFPATVQNVEFSSRYGAQAEPLSSRTAEGLSLSLHLAFQYRLVRDDIPRLYSMANIYYEPLYIKVARRILPNAAGKYNANQFWTERRRIGEEMFTLLNQSLRDSLATCSGLQLLVIGLPEQYETSIVKTQVQKQTISTREYAQKAAVIRAEIGVMNSGYEKNVTVTLAGAHANAKVTTMSAEARASQQKIDAETQAVSDVQESMPHLSPEALVTYQRNFNYETIPNATFLFGVQNAVTVKGNREKHVTFDLPTPPAASELPVCSSAGRN